MAASQRRSASCAFPLRKMRISQGDSFRALYRTGHRLEAPGLLFFWLPSPDQQNRMATIIRKKSAKSAVLRNRVRRIMREVTRQQIPQFTRPCWMLFDIQEIPKKGASAILRASAEQLMERGPRCADF